MTAALNPVGACGDTAPTGDPVTNTVSYVRAFLGEQTKEAERQRDLAVAALDYLLAALDGGQQWDIDHAIHRGVIVANNLKDRP